MGLICKIRPARENQGRRVDFQQTEGFLHKITTRRGTGSTHPSDLKPTTEIRSASARGRARGRASERWQAGRHCQRPRMGRTDRRGPAPGAQTLTGGSGRGTRVHEAVSRDLGHVIEIRRGESKSGRG
jgi:hypothetical protein